MKSNILIKPIVTEKTIELVNKLNKYTFMVLPSAEKIEISKAVALKFGVKVLSVQTQNLLGKNVRFGKDRRSGRRSDSKKAIVTLKAGDKIDLFDIK
jgi:large subunit ribosomal protein L23